MQNNIIAMIASKNRYLELASFFSSLTEKQIPYAVVKGEPLSLVAYGKIGQRNSSDVDLLVSTKSLRSIKSELLYCGFEIQNKNRFDQVTAVSSSHQSVPYYKITNKVKIEVDLNHDLFWGEYQGKRINIEEYLSDVIEMEIYGCKITALPTLKAFVQLILHHYKEMNSIYHLSGHNCINHNMFRDVYCLWKNNSEALSFKNLHSIACEYGIVPYVFYILFFSNEIYQDSELSKYVDAFRTPEGLELLDYYGLAEKERKPWRFDFKTRLNAENMYELIEDDLTQEDLEKLERNRRIFG